MKSGLLHLDRENRIADGRRADVYRARLHAPFTQYHGDTGSVAVVAKLAKGDCRSHHLLKQEGRAYAMAGPHLAAQEREDKDEQGPVVPRFYGLYVPVDAAGRMLYGTHPECDGYVHADCKVEWPSPILLMEDCGVPIDTDELKYADRQACWSLVNRLHDAGIAHGAVHARNILVQPGPLNIPRDERTLATPSFRLISLGRAELLWPGRRAGPPTRLEMHGFAKARERDALAVLGGLRAWEGGGASPGQSAALVDGSPVGEIAEG
ncbi:hypothetical protein C8Q77DRAFT_1056000 [Trametes polyzona]|nr:hypothetical protein C8Q77DRAFT_1056000 [Trametes polyzona]